MFKGLKSIFSELKYYHDDNFLVNYLLLLTIVIVILVEASQNIPILFGWNVATVNFYLEVLVNLCIGYIVSTIFYVLVVYYPHRKRAKLVNTRVRIIFSRLQARLKSFSELIVSSANIKVDASKGVPQSYTDALEKLDIFALLEKKEVFDPCSHSNALEHIIRDSSEIMSYKHALVHYLAFMDVAELKLYADLEDILIFENMDEIDKLPYKSHFLAQEFQYVVTAYNDCQNVLNTKKYPVVWETTE